MRDRGEKKSRWRSGRVAAIAGTAILLAAAPALASGAGAHTYQSWVSWLSDVDGWYFCTYGPNPDLGSTESSLTHTRGYFNTADYYFNGVGFDSVNGSNNHNLAYQISDQNGNYLYYVVGYTYGVGDNVSAGFWHNSGNSWHFNWWDSNAGINVGIDANNAYASGPGFDQASVGVDSWGGCPSGYPTNQQWNWIARYAPNGGWYDIPTDGLYNWGNTPSWTVWGDAANGNTVAESTTSCP